MTEQELLAPMRGVLVALALTIPFWIMVGIAIGYAIR